MDSHPAVAVARLSEVPLEPDELTAGMLTGALGGAMRQPGAKVARVRWKRIGQDRGFTGVVARGLLEWEPPGAGPVSVIAKFPLLAAELSGYRKLMQGQPGMSRLYAQRAEREAWFYESVAPAVPTPVPRC